MFELRMTPFLVAACLVPLLAGCDSASPGKSRTRIEVAKSAKVRLDGVTIVDTRSGALTPGMSILMDQGRIALIEPTKTAANAPSIKTVDLTGKFVVPGFNDMHSHALTAPNASGALAVMLADGVTGFRQMDSSPDLLASRNDHTLPLTADGPALLAIPGNLLTPFTAPTVGDVISEIDKQKKQGADFIKVALVSPTVFFAALAEAKRVKLPAVGHLQEGVDPAAASRAGFRSIEHLGPGDTMWIGCSSNDKALLIEAAQHPRLKAPPFKIPSVVGSLFAGKISKTLVNPSAFEKAEDITRLQRALDSYSSEKCRVLAKLFVTKDTWQTPTLVRLRSQYLAGQPEYERDPALAYIPAASLKEWREVTKNFRQLPAAMHATYRETYRRDLQLTKMFAVSGVQMMSGTDNGGQQPGMSLLQEFDELAKAGLSPLQILQMTTINPARFLKRTATMGTVTVGKNADLVLLDANPIANAQNLHRIVGVVRAGFYRPASDLKRLKDRVAAGQGYIN